jgi:acetylglutamate kinase
VKIAVDLRIGDGHGVAWGCDLSYDYVKINADYTSLIVETPSGGVAKDDRLTHYTPKFKVSLLVEALRYIERFAGKRCVIHARGEAMRSESSRRAFAGDVLLLRSVGLVPVVVHEGGHPLEAELVAAVGRRAIGLSDRDAALLTADQGSIEVNRSLLELLLAQGYVPIVGPGAEAEAAAAAIAEAVGAAKLIFVSDAPGVVEAGELVPELSADALSPEESRAAMIRAALAGGVEAVHLVDGRTPHGVIAELFTDRGVGTLVRR